jgi:hypothetical protein
MKRGEIYTVASNLYGLESTMIRPTPLPFVMSVFGDKLLAEERTLDIGNTLHVCATGILNTVVLGVARVEDVECHAFWRLLTVFRTLSGIVRWVVDQLVR